MTTALVKRQLQLGRKRGRLAQAQKPPATPQPRRKKQPPKVTKSKLLKAICGTYGIVSTIAKALDVTCQCVYSHLKDPAWADVKAAYEEERERLVDVAEQTIADSMDNHLHPEDATRNARYILSRRGRSRGYADESKVKVVGGNAAEGDQPVQVQGQIDLETLNLPLEVRRQILEAHEQAEKAKEQEHGTQPSQP